MGKKEFQKIVRSSQGYILSDGTLKVDDLLLAFHQFAIRHNLRSAKKLVSQVESLFEYTCNLQTNLREHFSFLHRLGKVRLKDDYESLESASYLLNEDIFQYMDDIAPKNYYFGSQEGDGALIGFWKVEQ